MQIYPRLLSAYKTKVRINKSLFWGGYYFVYPAGWTWNITTRFAVKHLNEIDLHGKKKSRCAWTLLWTSAAGSRDKSEAAALGGNATAAVFLWVFLFFKAELQTVG